MKTATALKFAHGALLVALVLALVLAVGRPLPSLRAIARAVAAGAAAAANSGISPPPHAPGCPIQNAYPGDELLGHRMQVCVAANIDKDGRPDIKTLVKQPSSDARWALDSAAQCDPADGVCTVTLRIALPSSAPPRGPAAHQKNQQHKTNEAKVNTRGAGDEFYLRPQENVHKYKDIHKIYQGYGDGSTKSQQSTTGIPVGFHEQQQQNYHTFLHPFVRQQTYCHSQKCPGSPSHYQSQRPHSRQYFQNSPQTDNSLPINQDEDIEWQNTLPYSLPNNTTNGQQDTIYPSEEEHVSQNKRSQENDVQSQYEPQLAKETSFLQAQQSLRREDNFQNEINQMNVLTRQSETDQEKPHFQSQWEEAHQEQEVERLETFPSDNRIETPLNPPPLSYITPQQELKKQTPREPQSHMQQIPPSFNHKQPAKDSTTRPADRFPLSKDTPCAVILEKETHHTQLHSKNPNVRDPYCKGQSCVNV